MPSCQQTERKQDAHADAVWCLEWLSDSLLLTGSVDGTLKCWGVDPTGRIGGATWTSEPGEFQMGVVSIARLEEGKTFAATSMDGCIRIFALNSPKPLRRIEAGPVDCWTLCASADGLEVASGTSTGAVNLWDVATGKLRNTFETHGQFVLSVAWHGSTIAAGTRDGSVFLINTLTGDVAATSARMHQLPLRALKFSPAGDRLFSASDDGLVSLVTVPGGEKVGLLKGHLAGVLGVSVALDSELVATASADRKVRVWNSDTKECTATFEAHTGQAFCLGFSPNQKLLVSGGAAGELQVYAVSN